MHVRRSTNHHQVRAREGGGVRLMVRNHRHVAERLHPSAIASAIARVLP